MAINNRPTTQVKVRVETNPAVILAQLMIAATLAVPIGMLAAAAGMAVSRNQGGQVRIAYYAVNATPSPTPSPSPVGTLPAPTNLQLIEVGQNYAAVSFNQVPGAIGYFLYVNGSQAAYYPFDEFRDVYFVRNLTANTFIQIFVAAMGADQKTGAKAGPASGQTASAAATCERDEPVEAEVAYQYESCTQARQNATCGGAGLSALTKLSKVACASPCNCYYSPKPLNQNPRPGQLNCEQISESVANSLVPPNPDIIGWYNIVCKKWGTAYCRVKQPNNTYPCPLPPPPPTPK